jgi:hypothetical protein
VRSLVRFIAVATLVCLLVPGLGEAAENLWHVVRTGHSAHDLSAGEQHVPDEDEHGCTGTFHLCSCHQTLAYDLGLVPVRPALIERRDPGCAAAERSPEPFFPGLDHPPRV